MQVASIAFEVADAQFFEIDISLVPCCIAALISKGKCTVSELQLSGVECPDGTRRFECAICRR